MLQNIAADRLLFSFCRITARNWIGHCFHKWDQILPTYPAATRLHGKCLSNIYNSNTHQLICSVKSFVPASRWALKLLRSPSLTETSNRKKEKMHINIITISFIICYCRFECPVSKWFKIYEVDVMFIFLLVIYFYWVDKLNCAKG